MAAPAEPAPRRSSRRKPTALERVWLGLGRLLTPAPIVGSRRWVPEIRVADRRKELVLWLASREFDARKIRIQVSDGVLTFSVGGIEETEGSAGPISYRAFERKVVLPPGVDWRHCSARASGHVLLVRFPKEARAPEGAPRGRRLFPFRVREVMTRKVRFVTPQTSVAEAAGLLRVYDYGSVPVCRDGRVVGILTDRDIAIRVTAEGQDPTVVLVSDVMTADPITCSPDHLLAEAEQMMAAARVRRLPVVGPGGKLVGFLSTAKIARRELEVNSGHLLRKVSQPGSAEISRPESRP